MKFQMARTVLVLVLMLGFRVAAQGGASEITWLRDYDVARAYARQTGQPLLVSFRCVP